MKVRLNAGDMKLNRKAEKIIKKYQKMCFRKENGDNFFF